MDDKIQALVAWARRNDAQLHENVQIYDDKSYGICMKAHSPLSAGSQIVSCPFAVSLSYFNALDLFPSLKRQTPAGYQFPPEIFHELKPHVIGNFFLMLQFLCGEDSFWHEYIKCLPQPNEPEKMGTPMFWGQADRKFLAGTQVGASLELRERSWKTEWEAGRLILDRAQESRLESLSGLWTLELYRWAATIYSSRSFISNVIPEKFFQDCTDPAAIALFSREEEGKRNAQTFKAGIIPMLFPLVDLANHDPRAKVTWFSDVQSIPEKFSLQTDVDLAAGEQIFNNYAPKGNSQLLLGYGFVLPDNDDLNLAPRALEGDSLEMKKGWEGSKDGIGSLERKSYTVRSKPFDYEEGKRLEAFNKIYDGFVDHLALLVANKRERLYFKPYADQRVETHARLLLGGPLGRCILAIASASKEMLQVMLDRVSASGESLGKPTTSAQHIAMSYRQGQISLLKSATFPLSLLLQSSICSTPTTSQTSLISLSSAFTEPFFSSRRGQKLLASAEQSIRQELEIQPDEDLNWDELEEDWGFTMWCLWTFMQLLDVWRTEPEPQISGSWISHIHECEEYGRKGSEGIEEGFCGEASEWEAFENMCNSLETDRLGWEHLTEGEMIGLMLEAGRIVQAESIMVRVASADESDGGEGVLKRMMCMYQTTASP